MAASKESLGILHQLMTMHFTKRFLAGDITAAELTVLRAFLKDNNVVYVPGETEDVAKLAEALRAQAQELGMDGDDIAEALARLQPMPESMQ